MLIALYALLLPVGDRSTRRTRGHCAEVPSHFRGVASDPDRLFDELDARMSEPRPLAVLEIPRL